MSSWTYVVAPLAAGGAVGVGDTAPLAPQGDHAAVAVERLLEQFHDLPRMEAITRDTVAMLQSVEDLSWELLRKRYLYPIDGEGPAVGAQLDALGEILGEPRAGRSDAQYLLFLKVRILINVSDGKAEDLGAILALLAGDGYRVLDVPPAHIEVWIYSTAYPVDAWRAIREAKAAGVGLSLIYTVSPTSQGEAFKWSSSHSAEVSPAPKTGWADAHGAWSGGGLWAGGIR